MYQSEMKEGFIKDYMRSRVIARTSLYSLFRKTEPYERKYNKDCSYFEQDEILTMYREFKAKSIYTLMNYNVILKAYCAWRKYYHHEATTESYEHINIELLKPCIPADSNKFLSREEVTEIEDQLLNYTDKAIIECLWEGISGPSMHDLVSINSSIINHEEKTIRFADGRIVQLTDRLYSLLLKAFNEDEYICYGESLRIKKLFGLDVVVPSLPFPKMTLKEIYQELKTRYGYEIPEAEQVDLTTEAERLVYQLAKDKFNHEFMFVIDFPAEKRAFYHMRDDSGKLMGYDLIWRGVEITSGAQREHRYEKLCQVAKEKGLGDDVKFYLDFFKYGCPPHGGFAIGVDRLTMLLLGVGNVKESMFLFRGPNRLNP